MNNIIDKELEKYPGLKDFYNALLESRRLINDMAVNKISELKTFNKNIKEFTDITNDRLMSQAVENEIKQLKKQQDKLNNNNRVDDILNKIDKLRKDRNGK